ncbi:hypothetical protein ACAF76_006185 [Brevibacillus sp. TJ4]|uniref:hypothetical protein n=1 Tax=Brevibacillus sp. TJ4 TaxID=3234853 RepID=UPI0037CD5B38
MSIFKRSNLVFAFIVVILIVCNIASLVEMEHTKKLHEQLQNQIDFDFKDNLKEVGDSLKRNIDWNSKFEYALSHASKVQALVDKTSFASGSTKEARTVRSYGYMLESYFNNSKYATIDENPQELEEFIKCLEILSTNPTDLEAANKLISLLN